MSAPIDTASDAQVDEEIAKCLSLSAPKSFFLFAGAGSGKTRSLVKALDEIRRTSGRDLMLHGRRVGVITYTNAACDEVKQRTEFDPLVEVSTIHSFVWSLIKPFQRDLRSWLLLNLEAEIVNLQELLAKGKSGTKAAIDRANSITAKRTRIESIASIRTFTYSPTGDNTSRDSFSHSEVVKCAATFLSDKPLMQKLLVQKFPILFIDESQDTNGLLMDAIMKVEARHREHFTLGLFGDMMQRIYGDGKPDLGQDLPSKWAKPVKKINHRSPRRIVQLINRLRSETDGNIQETPAGAPLGFVRMFVGRADFHNKVQFEARVAGRMAEITDDEKWLHGQGAVETLLLEHHMAAKRLGFAGLYEPLHKVESLRTGLLNGDLPAIRIFTEGILPLVEASHKNDKFLVAAIVKKRTPLLRSAAFAKIDGGQLSQLKKANDAVNSLMELWSDGATPSCIDTLKSVATSQLFEIPESLRPITMRSIGDQEIIAVENQTRHEEKDDIPDDVLDAWDKALACDFRQIEAYRNYINGSSGFRTHQGVKGLEFDRVMVINDDTEARGFMFGYEKLFGAKALSKTDLEHERGGSESGVDRTRRLFYVTCSRAKRSLAIVVYTENPSAVRQHAVASGWLEDAEIEIVAL